MYYRDFFLHAHLVTIVAHFIKSISQATIFEARLVVKVRQYSFRIKYFFIIFGSFGG